MCPVLPALHRRAGPWSPMVTTLQPGLGCRQVMGLLNFVCNEMGQSRETSSLAASSVLLTEHQLERS